MGNKKSKQKGEEFEFHPDRLYTTKVSGSTTSSEGDKNISEEIHLRKKADNFLARESIFIDTDLLVERVSGTPLEQYTIISKLGEGFYGQVWKVKNKLTGNICAMKKMNKHKGMSIEDDMLIINEFETMKKIDHPNIVKIFQFYSTDEAYFIIMEYCKGGELYYQIVNNGPFNEEESAYVLYQILSAIFYCHSNNIIHRDLKPENILIEKKEQDRYFTIKICDFGTATIFEKGRTERKIVGSSYYIAPEVLLKNYNEKCDLWSCGVILYILLSGKPPFSGDTDQEVIQTVLKGKYDLNGSPFDTISKEAKNLIISLLQVNPENRISAVDALKHPWFKNLNIRKKINPYLNPENEKIIEKYLFNLSQYTNKTILKNTTIAYLVHNFPQLEEIEIVGKIFNKMDLNEDGKISKDELIAFLNNFSNYTQDFIESEANKIFDNIDTNHNGVIELEEFIVAAIDKSIFLTEDLLKFAFRYYDKNNNGVITFDELMATFMHDECNKEIPEIEQNLKIVFDMWDLNKNGEISFDEFKEMMTTILTDDFNVQKIQNKQN